LEQSSGSLKTVYAAMIYRGLISKYTAHAGSVCREEVLVMTRLASDITADFILGLKR